MLRHLKVCRKYGDRECDQANAGEPPEAGDKHTDSAEDFAPAADLDEQHVRRQPRWNDAHVKCGMEKMIAACSNKEEPQQRDRDTPPQWASLPSGGEHARGIRTDPNGFDVSGRSANEPHA